MQPGREKESWGGERGGGSVRAEVDQFVYVWTQYNGKSDLSFKFTSVSCMTLTGYFVQVSYT